MSNIKDTVVQSNDLKIPKRLIIIGAGGHGRVVADCAEQTGNYKEIAFLDDCFSVTDNINDEPRKYNCHWQIIGNINDWHLYSNTADFIIAFGDNFSRLTMQQTLVKHGVTIVSIIHPRAAVSPYAQIGQGSVVFANAVVNINSCVGDACIINTGATVDHDCTLADGVHLSPNVSLAGGVKIGKLSWLGIGSIVIQQVTISQECQTGAGTVIIKPIEHAGVYVGNPARKLTR